VSPLTGLPGAVRSVTAVKVDNVAVGPQTGLNQADIVYCEEVEGGLTRLLAVFSSQTPAAVGPVRSARTSDLQLLGEYGRVALAFSGANHGTLASVRAANLQDDGYDAHPSLYHFDDARSSPYQFLVNVAQLVAAVPGVLAKDIGFRFGTATGVGTPVNALTVTYPGAKVGASWNAASKQWLISRDGSPQRLTDGTQASATDVLVQYVQIGTNGYTDVNHNPTPTSATVGTGRAVLLRDGKRYDGTWSRPSMTAPTTWTATGGGTLTLAPGRIWVLLTPTAAPVSTS